MVVIRSYLLSIPFLKVPVSIILVLSVYLLTLHLGGGPFLSNDEGAGLQYALVEAFRCSRNPCLCAVVIYRN